MPKRIQRKRTKGWKMPEGAVYVGRPTRWGNPYPVEVFGREEAIRKFRGLFQHEQGNSTEFPVPTVEDLHGKDLACWCPLDKACHADVLLEVANK
jgi:hypothetical protein